MDYKEMKALPRAVDYPAMIAGLFTKELGGIAGQRMHAAVGIAGECAEVVKGHLLNDFDNVLEESGDAYFYHQALQNQNGWTDDELLLMGTTVDIVLLDYELLNLTHTAGDLLDLAKKCWVYGKDFDQAKFKQAMANWLHAFHAFIAIHDITIEDCKAHNQYKLVTGPTARYKGGNYSDAAAIARADKAPGT